MVDTVVSVRRLQSGQRAEIESIVGDRDHIHRLEELGIGHGTLVEVFRGGNPIILRTSGSKLCVRWDRNLDILVRPKGKTERCA